MVIETTTTQRTYGPRGYLATDGGMDYELTCDRCPHTASFPTKRAARDVLWIVDTEAVSEYGETAICPCCWSRP